MSGRNQTSTPAVRRKQFLKDLKYYMLPILTKLETSKTSDPSRFNGDKARILNDFVTSFPEEFYGSLEDFLKDAEKSSNPDFFSKALKFFRNFKKLSDKYYRKLRRIKAFREKWDTVHEGSVVNRKNYFFKQMCLLTSMIMASPGENRPLLRKHSKNTWINFLLNQAFNDFQEFLSTSAQGVSGVDCPGKWRTALSNSFESDFLSITLQTREEILFITKILPDDLKEKFITALLENICNVGKTSRPDEVISNIMTYLKFLRFLSPKDFEEQAALFIKKTPNIEQALDTYLEEQQKKLSKGYLTQDEYDFSEEVCCLMRSKMAPRKYKDEVLSNFQIISIDHYVSDLIKLWENVESHIVDFTIVDLMDDLRSPNTEELSQSQKEFLQVKRQAEISKLESAKEKISRRIDLIKHCFGLKTPAFDIPSVRKFVEDVIQLVSTDAYPKARLSIFIQHSYRQLSLLIPVILEQMGRDQMIKSLSALGLVHDPVAWSQLEQALFNQLTLTVYAFVYSGLESKKIPGAENQEKAKELLTALKEVANTGSKEKALELLNARKKLAVGQFKIGRINTIAREYLQAYGFKNADRASLKELESDIAMAKTLKNNNAIVSALSLIRLVEPLLTPSKQLTLQEYESALNRIRVIQAKLNEKEKSKHRLIRSKSRLSTALKSVLGNVLAQAPVTQEKNTLPTADQLEEAYESIAKAYLKIKKSDDGKPGKNYANNSNAINAASNIAYTKNFNGNQTRLDYQRQCLMKEINRVIERESSIFSHQSRLLELCKAHPLLANEVRVICDQSKSLNNFYQKYFSDGPFANSHSVKSVSKKRGEEIKTEPAANKSMRSASQISEKKPLVQEQVTQRDTLPMPQVQKGTVPSVSRVMPMRNTNEEVLGFSRIKITADGNCFYNALRVFDNTYSAQGLRENVVSYLRSNQSNWVDFLRKEIDVDKYLAGVVNPDAWADQLEIRALSVLLNRPIIIIDASYKGGLQYIAIGSESLLKSVSAGNIPRDQSGPVFLYRTEGGTNAGERLAAHYDALSLLGQGLNKNQALWKKWIDLRESLYITITYEDTSNWLRPTTSSERLGPVRRRGSVVFGGNGVGTGVDCQESDQKLPLSHLGQ